MESFARIAGWKAIPAWKTMENCRWPNSQCLKMPCAFRDDVLTREKLHQLQPPQDLSTRNLSRCVKMNPTPDQMKKTLLKSSRIVFSGLSTGPYISQRNTTKLSLQDFTLCLSTSNLFVDDQSVNWLITEVVVAVG